MKEAIKIVVEVNKSYVITDEKDIFQNHARDVAEQTMEQPNGKYMDNKYFTVTSNQPRLQRESALVSFLETKINEYKLVNKPGNIKGLRTVISRTPKVVVGPIMGEAPIYK